ncbi:hypothetical protein H4684_003290 [Desulfomicrobium macestii]|uniref:GIY-YIG domain-containing protein n=1 Tax=Desulfomicrobium macestii TaxID=90731 RepID=A0ABR9H7E1_9BACT|nr:hypothetical protein [Desulfomicrobium macestii]MBE1426624.1 hypothetical protein [Desulfomicrobium macestii]
MEYSITTSSITNLTSVFHFEDLKRDFPFNIKVATKPEAKRDIRFFGPGIYSIFDVIDNRMIYIGIYTPTDSVIDKRFRKHIQTLTLRGKEVTFKSSLPKSVFLSKIGSEGLVQDLNRCRSFDELLVKDRCVSHINKVRYAAANWDEFRNWTPGKNSTRGTETRFSFQFDKIIGEKVDKKMLKNIESRLISCFNPLTNSSHSAAYKPEYESQSKLTDIVKTIVSQK